MGGCLSRIDAVICNICRILLMETDGYIQLFYLFHGSAHQCFSQNRHAVIRKACGSFFKQALHRRQLFSLHSHRDRCTGFHMDAGFPAFFQHIGKCLFIVHRRPGVCHQHHRRVAALCRRTGTRGNVFLVSKTGVTEMGMDIHQSRCRHKPGSINHLKVFRQPFFPVYQPSI